MLYELSNREVLRSWLVRTLEPICDAEPGALADYVLALLEHDAPEHELRKEFISQLGEFLENGAAGFVDQLFAALRSKSYIPYSADPVPSSSSRPADDGIPIPLDAILSAAPGRPQRGRKRSLERDETEHNLRGPPKGPRLSSDAYYPRYQEGSAYSESEMRELPIQTFGTNGDEGRDRARFSQNGRGGAPTHVPRGVCRDYHLKGYCARGAMCKYSHDDSAFVPGPMQFPPGIPNPMATMPSFMQMFGGGLPFPLGMAGPGAAYDPNESHMDLRPSPVPMQQDQSAGAYVANIPQGGRDAPITHDYSNTHPGQSDIAGLRSGEHAASNRPPSATFSHNDHIGLRPAVGGNPAFRGRGRGRGRGTFTGDHANFRDSGSRDSKTIVVEKIPPEHLSLEGVNTWFKRFGTVTNVAVDVPSGKALVSFATNDEARAAWKAEEAIFNNRFVKVYWHRPMEGQGAVGNRALQASAPIIANLASRESTSIPNLNPPKPAPSSARSESAAKPIPGQSHALSALAAKQQLLEKQIAEQKELMAKLATASNDEKKSIMERLRKLGQEMKSPLSSVPAKPVEDKEQKTKALLDLELDVHAESAVSKPDSGEGEDTTEGLVEKLAKLRAEADSLGLTEPSNPYSPSGYRPYRGRGRARGRGRGQFRGAPMRGRPFLKGMSLDNRPKVLVVQGLDAQNPDSVQSVRTWYEENGSVDSFEVQDDSTILVGFKTRASAEQALSKGSNLPLEASISVTWQKQNIPASAKSMMDGQDDASNNTASEDRPVSPRYEDDNYEQSGWGNGYEDNMGM